MDKVQKNLSDIERKLEKSNKIAAKGDKLTLSDVIKLGRKSNSITTTIEKCTREYNGANPTEAETKKILKQLSTIVELCEVQVDLLVRNKPQLEKLHVGGLVKKSMAKSDRDSKALERLILAKVPAVLKAQSEVFAKRLQVAFDRAKVAFAESTGGEDQIDGEDESV